MTYKTPEQCRRKEDQHWEMAGLARQDKDTKDEIRHTKLARFWQECARDGGYDSDIHGKELKQISNVNY